MKKQNNHSPVSPIAKTVIDLCGGFDVVAAWLDLSVTQVYRFTYPKDKGGTGGLIPAPHQQTILTNAKKNSIGLKPEHFFECVEEAA